MKSTPAQRAKELLQLHHGACFVPANSALVKPFRAMEKAGTVLMTPAPREQAAGFNVSAVFVKECHE